MKPMGEIIKEERIKAGLTQTELGEMLGVQKNAVCKWERGRVLHIKQDMLYMMSKIFGCTPSYLLGFEDKDDIDFNLKIANDIVAKIVTLANGMTSKEQRMLLSYARFISSDAIVKKGGREGGAE